MNIELTPAARRIIDRLLKTGLYGNHEADVCERIFYEKLREIEAQERDEPPQAERVLR